MSFFFDVKKIIDNTLLSLSFTIVIYLLIQFFPTLNCQKIQQYPRTLFNATTYGKVLAIRPINEKINIVQYYFYIDNEIQNQQMELDKNVMLNVNETIIVSYDAFDYFDSAIVGKPLNISFEIYILVFLILFSLISVVNWFIKLDNLMMIKG